MVGDENWQKASSVVEQKWLSCKFDEVHRRFCNSTGRTFEQHENVINSWDNSLETL